jgi:hypothetical protein
MNSLLRTAGPLHLGAGLRTCRRLRRRSVSQIDAQHSLINKSVAFSSFLLSSRRAIRGQSKDGKCPRRTACECHDLFCHAGPTWGCRYAKGVDPSLHNQDHLGGAEEDRRPSRGPTPRSPAETTMVLPDQDRVTLTARWYSLPGWCAITATPATARAQRIAAKRIFSLRENSVRSGPPRQKKLPGQIFLG